jgi:iron-sulfur cluster assembly protein
MAEDDCGATFQLAQGDDVEIIPVTIEVTDNAMSAMEGAMSSSDGDDVLVVSVLGGGCSGFMYDMQIQSRPTDEGWQFVSCDDITIAIHDRDSVQLSGITLDFENSLMGGGFKILNPNAAKACSCGKSFR